MTTASPREVLQRFVDYMADGPDEAAADLCTEDAVFELPYLMPGVPEQKPGREAFRAHLRHGATMQKSESVDPVSIHETADPELVVVEYRLQGHVLATGRKFAFDIVMFARVRDGLITWSRTYSNPLDSAIAFGAAERLLTAIAAG
ncbi:nuclear transport factor 2 family protein [Kitasatospora sp. NPDC002965]|uniref:nuclear transport factor 2 family protein n=1 Tax=Kitasatospora sp. NPDC002965 TaxID=3154775 RepID=UPI0033AA2F62